MQRKGEESVTLSCVLWPAGAGEAEDCSFQETQCAQWIREVDVVEPLATRAGCTESSGLWVSQEKECQGSESRQLSLTKRETRIPPSPQGNVCLESTQ